ncbi:hypothetical protein Aduo_014470 [Ancylostoma duodenale]
MVRKEATKGQEEVMPLLKDAKKGDGKEEKKAARDDAGEAKRTKAAAAGQAGQKTKAPSAKEERKDAVAQKQDTPAAFTAPSQSTQSMSPEVKELYPPDKIKVVSLNDIMDVSNSQSFSKAQYVRTDDGKAVAIKEQNEPQKAVLDQQLFDKQFGYRRVDLTLGRKVHWHFKQVLKWRKVDWAHFFMGRVPITKWLPSYNWLNDLKVDVLGGVMLSIMSLPQGLAYGYLVGVPPIYGLITATFGPLVYTIFGSSRHNSPGCFAIAALMVGGVVEQFAHVESAEDPIINSHHSNICCKSASSVIEVDAAISVTSSITFLVGLWQIFFGLLNAGLLAVWLSDHLVQGLTSGAAVHVFTSQLKAMTGVDGVPPTSEPFGLIKFYLCFFRRLRTIKLPCVIISLIGNFLLLLSSYFIDPILKKWTNLKFPMELFLVAFSILLVFLSEGTRYQINVPVVGKVESGFPSPQVPSFDLVSELVWHGISIAIISFVIHIALAKLVSKKFHYEIDVNQEWFALGAMNTISSFFGCFVGGSSIGRTMTLVKFGTTSQLSTMVCCFIMVGFVYGAGAFIYHLPKAVLACIILCAMKDLYIQLFRGFGLCRQSTVDFMIFFVTLVSVVLINVNTGLIIGIVFALLTVVFRTQWADSTCMGRIPGTSDFKGLGHYRSAEEIPGIKVFRFDAPLYFANAELFILSVHNACGLNPVLVKAKLIERAAAEKAKETMDESSEANKTSSGDMQLRVVGRRLADASVDSVAEDPAEHVVTQLTHIIIDCSTIPYIDLMGKDAIAQTFADYATIDITVLIANCKVAVRQLFETSDFYQKVPKNRMFVSVNDAVTQALKEQRERVPERKQIDHTDGPRHVAKDPVALSPAQKTVVLNVLNEEGEEQITQSAASTTLSTQRADISAEVRKDSAQVRKNLQKFEKKKEDKVKKDDKKKEEPAKKEEKPVKKEEKPAKKEEKKKDEGKRLIWRRFSKAASKKDVDKTQ